VAANEVRETADWSSYGVVTWTRRDPVSLDNDPVYRPLIGKVLRTVLMTAALAGVLFAGCVTPRTETDVSNDPAYASVVGKEYRTKGDFILFKFKDDPEVQLAKPGVSEVPYLDEVKGKKFPFKYQGNTVVGVLPAGSQFKVTRVMLVRGSPMNYAYFNALITVGKGFEGWKIIPSWLGGGGLHPKFKPELLEEVKPAAGQ
jgi:hypothetical protein